eukprot:8472670-Alexandrium_andersonii.AAC.1
MSAAAAAASSAQPLTAEQARQISAQLVGAGARKSSCPPRPKHRRLNGDDAWATGRQILFLPPCADRSRS